MVLVATEVIDWNTEVIVSDAWLKQRYFVVLNRQNGIKIYKPILS